MARLSFHLFPGCCILCHGLTGRDIDICPPCQHDLPWISQSCFYCGLPLAETTDICRNCRDEKPPFSAVLAALEYRFPVDILIQRFKSNRHLASGRVLAELLVRCHTNRLNLLTDPATVVVPIPLHWTRQMSRGFNQAAFIAEPVAHHMNLKVEHGVLRRVRSTPDQKSQTLIQREQNLRGAFEVRGDLRGRRIILVDDVVTTTATAKEISTLLVDAGADDVVVAAVARTPGRRL